MEYMIFTDESYIVAERYRSIGALSLPTGNYRILNESLKILLNESSVKELKWKKINNAKQKFCADKVINHILANIFKFDLRIEILTWDTQDNRHSIANRDDTANFERMFFHLVKYSISKRPVGSVWHILPDERLGIDWDTINDCLANVGKRKDFNQKLLFDDIFENDKFSVKSLKQVESHKYPCTQIADIFGGMSVYSIQSFDKIIKKRNELQISLLPEPEINYSNRDKYRCEVLCKFLEQARSKKLGISINSKRRLDTPNPKNPINFWFYEPQHSEDKAPTKKMV